MAVPDTVVDLNQPAPMVDDRLLSAKIPPSRFFKRNRISWFLESENQDYFPGEILEVSVDEATNFKNVSEELYGRLLEATQYVAMKNLWEPLGIPASMAPLIRYSLDKELENHIIGRFDFGGGLVGSPIKLLEFNADTCSLMPETHHVQTWQYESVASKHKGSGQFNNLMNKLIRSFQDLLARYPDKEPYLLLSGVGHQEDRLNLEIIGEAARKGGFKEVHFIALEKVIFSEDEGIFLEVGPDQFLRFDFWFKMVPWEFMIYEEPELLEVLSQIILNELAIVINPAFTALMQSKGILKYLHDLFPNHPNILRAAFSDRPFSDHRFVSKPIFGRTGENVSLYNGFNQPAASNSGDYGGLPLIYQELTELDKDEDGDIYQPSVFWSQEASALCFRRQDDLIVDDDAEFMSHLIK